MIKLNDNSKIVQVYNHFRAENPKDLLDVLLTLIFPLISLINFLYFCNLFFSTKTLYVVDYLKGEIHMTNDPNLGNQFVAFIFLSLGWIIVPFLKAVYRHQWDKETSIHMLIASLGLYSVLASTSFFFAIFLIILMFKNTGLNPYVAKIKSWPRYQRIYRWLFPSITHSSPQLDS